MKPKNKKATVPKKAAPLTAQEKRVLARILNKARAAKAYKRYQEGNGK